MEAVVTKSTYFPAFSWRDGRKPRKIIPSKLFRQRFQPGTRAHTRTSYKSRTLLRARYGHNFLDTSKIIGCSVTELLCLCGWPACSMHVPVCATSCFHMSILTVLSRVLEKLTVPQPVKKFPTFYGTRRFITVFTSARHLSLS